ncbi:hypothetical protein RJ492_000520 [Pluralibacter gergoviae]|uniref:DNA-binding protein n=1 Tax=Pluralibacter gergoviae TaxID=61647 RepID=A0AAI9GJ96_PLUGE|nr:hypothetical protein [Pluralibacter gergoviae]AVR03740.1 hypothetical protein A8H26_14100 [Pluralibacter gergoviae]EKV0913251.1 hypothetical protein [Pluralibacter gergoviae]EKV9907924.1 hypothetical protein [Pluralibacter gergoviae]EKW6617745.1 hypothetical protein [Pluralibacter gergoviae]EKW7272486.1 hypothetical protein [Pluralibacter gergoviae]
MASKNLWKIVTAMRERGEITPREVRALVGCDSKKANRLLEHLVRAGVVSNVGLLYHPVYRLRRGDINLKPIKPATEKPSRQRVSITEQCRQNWQGYQVHKIFGSAKQ